MGLLRRYESEIYGNYKKYWFIYGLYTGLIMCFSILFRYWLTYPMDSPSTWVDNIVLFFCMFIFTYLYRKKLYCGNIFFKEIYILNLGIGVVAAVIYALFVWYYGSCVDVEFLQRYIDAQEHIYLNNWQGTNEDMNMMIENIKTLTTVPYLSIMGGILTVVTSLIVAFIVAILLRTQKNVVRQKK